MQLIYDKKNTHLSSRVDINTARVIGKHLNLLLILCIIFLSNANANEKIKQYNIKQLEQLAEKFVNKIVFPPENGKLVTTASKQDPRTKVPGCAKALEISSSNASQGRSNITVKITCPDSPSWHQYLPVHVKYLSPVLTAINQLEKGVIIESNDVTLNYIGKLKLRGSHFTDKRRIIGAKTKRRIPSGGAITAKQICVVCDGDPVTLIINSGGLELKTEGIAQSDGSIGERVKVENKRSKRMVYGRVSKIGTVKVNL